MVLTVILHVDCHGTYMYVHMEQRKKERNRKRETDRHRDREKLCRILYPNSEYMAG